MPLKIKKKKNWSPHKRTKIFTVYELGMLVRDIAVREGLSVQVIYSVVLCYC